MPKGNWREFAEFAQNNNFLENPSIQNKTDRTVRVQRTRGGKAGKTVTVIKGLDLTVSEAKMLLKQLKTICGTGGTLKEGIMELQGDQVKTSMEFLAKEGFSPRQSGG
ncbi:MULTISPECIES: translation initiation factor [Prochlorococcus]|uniref:Translation initiation factor SUI1 n=1 Tax=Prochlorococcus marinus (strain SARG / CCMP1375 / SS120) TaxID=167539 RepID=Q7VE25_PROMA|nr:MULTISPECIES: translation initiation factor [Prochlorococcus]AAP99235.1 Translation initiation factor SUI1 [Prochlorococcus marinus subsp. marinus str. CCMP1375]KGG11496.1 Translation initiation factor SUI1-related protein [Prochlorococcus marinus str. LG]KGG18550.1 Translation initiation factor SUI1-related protein [Prochlorococcus marinus str. SS2]KGG22823.1 Translation initiation factor SUI1-related protein [Prochlorococcus marinus str. SS35]KGG32699.1 Translation initiation factor SUI1-